MIKLPKMETSNNDTNTDRQLGNWYCQFTFMDKIETNINNKNTDIQHANNCCSN